MAYFNVNDLNRIQKSLLNYTFGDGTTTLYNTDSSIKKIEQTSSLKYYVINFPTNNGSTFTYTSNGMPTAYTAESIYIFGVLHNNITDITTRNPNIAGELVVQYSNNNDQSKKLYACFLISESDGSESYSAPGNNDIDNIIGMISTKGEAGSANYISQVDTNLNNTIPTQDNCLIYNDSGNVVIVFIAPVFASSITAGLLKKTFETSTGLFNISAPSNYIVSSTSSGAGDNKSGVVSTSTISNDDDQIYIDCNPTGESDEQIQTYNLPISSELMNQKQQLDFMKTSVNFFTFIIGIIFIFLTVPRLYKISIIDKVNALISDKILRFKRIRSADIIIIISFFIFIISTFSSGFSTDNYDLVTTGMFATVVLGLSLSLIQTYKTDIEFMQTKLDKDPKGDLYDPEVDNLNDLSDVLDVLKLIIVFALKDASIYYIVTAILTVIVLVILRYATNTINTWIFNYYLGLMLGLILPIFVVSLTWITKPNK